MNKQKTPLCSSKTALVLALGLMASLGLNQTARAADFYAGALIGSGKTKVTSIVDDSGMDLSDMTFSVFGGSQVWENNNGVGIGVEGFYTNFGDLAKHSYINGPYKGVSTLDGVTFGIAVIPSFTAGDIDVFGKLGLHNFSLKHKDEYSNLDGSDSKSENSKLSGTSYVLGAGVKYKIHDRFGIVALAEHYSLDHDGLNLDGSTVLSAGVQANF